MKNPKIGERVKITTPLLAPNKIVPIPYIRSGTIIQVHGDFVIVKNNPKEARWYHRRQCVRLVKKPRELIFLYRKMIPLLYFSNLIEAQKVLENMIANGDKKEEHFVIRMVEAK